MNWIPPLQGAEHYTSWPHSEHGLRTVLLFLFIYGVGLWSRGIEIRTVELDLNHLPLIARDIDV